MRVKVIKAPGYEDEWSGELISYLRTADGRPVAVIDSDNYWHVIPSEYVREPRTPDSPYDECGCIAPCPDHKTPSQDGRRDRAYWNDRYASDEATDTE